MTQQAIQESRIDQTPIAVLDVETTGLKPGAHRVVEVSIARIEPGSDPELAFDSLINPERSVAATDIHGIAEEDVEDAPRFAEIAGEIAEALRDCVVAGYNVYFDMRFIDYEFDRAGLSDGLPHLCLMYMRAMLGLGGRCSLQDACRQFGITETPTHAAASDAWAAARLWPWYLEYARKQGIHTFGDLAKIKAYKFVQSFQYPPLSTSLLENLPRRATPKPRTAVADTGATTSNAAEEASREPVSASEQIDHCGAYWDALKTVLSDLRVTDAEVDYLRRKQQELKLPDRAVRSLHARAFASVLDQFAEDHWLDEKEAKTIQYLYRCLERLGWAPGQGE